MRTCLSGREKVTNELESGEKTIDVGQHFDYMQC